MRRDARPTVAPAAPGGYKKVVRVLRVRRSARQNRNQPKPRLKVCARTPKHPLDLTDELAVPGRHAAARRQHFLAPNVDEVFVEIPTEAAHRFHRKRRVKGVGVARDTPDLANIGKLTP